MATDGMTQCIKCKRPIKDIAIRDALVTLGWTPPKEKEIPKCCVCGTTENLRKDGWYGYRCSSPDCICF